MHMYDVRMHMCDVRMHMCDVCSMCTVLVFVGSRACALLLGDTKCPALPHAALFT